MRWVLLYLRSRRVPFALAMATAAIALTWALWMVYADSPTVDARMLSLTVMLAVAAFSPTLSGPDDALDHTGSISWPVRRGVHLLLIAAGLTTLLLVTTVTDARFEPYWLVLRNTAGLLGLAALGAVLVGAARSWIAPLTWTLVAVTPLLGPGPELGIQVAGWLVQPAGTTAATVCASILAGAGLLAYALRGCPKRPATAV